MSHLRNTEYIYVATRDKAVIERLRAIGGRFGHELLDNHTPSSRPKPMQPSAAAVPAQVQAVVTDLNQRLEQLLRERGSVSSAEAQAATGADPGTLRAAFRSLVAAGRVTVTGATRGTRYVAGTGEDRVGDHARPPQTRLPAWLMGHPEDHRSAGAAPPGLADGSPSSAGRRSAHRRSRTVVASC